MADEPVYRDVAEDHDYARKYAAALKRGEAQRRKPVWDVLVAIGEVTNLPQNYEGTL